MVLGLLLMSCTSNQSTTEESLPSTSTTGSGQLLNLGDVPVTGAINVDTQMRDDSVHPEWPMFSYMTLDEASRPPGSVVPLAEQCLSRRPGETTFVGPQGVRDIGRALELAFGDAEFSLRRDRELLGPGQTAYVFDRGNADSPVIAAQGAYMRLEGELLDVAMPAPPSLTGDDQESIREKLRRRQFDVEWSVPTSASSTSELFVSLDTTFLLTSGETVKAVCYWRDDGHGVFEAPEGLTDEQLATADIRLITLARRATGAFEHPSLGAIAAMVQKKVNFTYF